MSNFRARNTFSAVVDSLTEQALYKACPWYDSPQKYKSKEVSNLVEPELSFGLFASVVRKCLV